MRNMIKNPNNGFSHINLDNVVGTYLELAPPLGDGEERYFELIGIEGVLSDEEEKELFGIARGMIVFIHNFMGAPLPLTNKVSPYKTIWEFPTGREAALFYKKEIDGSVE